MPGNKYLVIATKEGFLILYDINQDQILQEINDAHKKEIWELAMHSNPQVKNSRG